MIRQATLKDIPQLMNIWKTVFGDSNTFISWFFENRFSPEMCFLAEADEIVCSCMFGLDVSVNLSGKSIPAVLISAVATFPEFRGKGIMTDVFKAFINYLSEKNVPFVFYPTNVPQAYKNLRHTELSKALFAENCIPSKSGGSVHSELIDIADYSKKLCNCYMNNMHYNLMIDRSQIFHLKASEFIAEKQKCRAVFEKEQIIAYVIYEERDGKAFCSECIGPHEVVAGILCETGLPFSAKLPPDFPQEILSGVYELRGDVLGGIANKKAFIDVLRNNNLLSEKYKTKTADEMSAAELIKSVFDCNTLSCNYLPDLY